MLNSILSQFDTGITGLPFVERWGGLVRTMPLEFPGRDNKPVIKTFPVSCNVSGADCYETGKYKDLSPDTNFASVAYWQDLSGVTFSTGRRRGTFLAQADVRFVAWLNLKKLGVTTCDGFEAFVAHVIASSPDNSSISSPFKAGNIKLVPAFAEPKQQQRIFGEYSYDDIGEMFYYPYDFFAVRFKLSFVVGQDCLDALNITPVQCITV